jgi:hypothetical protein
MLNVRSVYKSSVGAILVWVYEFVFSFRPYGAFLLMCLSFEMMSRAWAKKIEIAKNRDRLLNFLALVLVAIGMSGKNQILLYLNLLCHFMCLAFCSLAVR